MIGRGSVKAGKRRMAGFARSGETPGQRTGVKMAKTGNVPVPAMLEGAGKTGDAIRQKMQKPPAPNPDAGKLTEGKVKPAVQI